MRSVVLISLLAGIFPNFVAAGIKVSPILSALQSQSKIENVPFRLLNAICFVESRHNPNAINQYDGGSASYGLCQIKISTARFMGFKGAVHSLFDVTINTRLAAKYLHYQLTRYRGDWIKAISAYNRGHAGKTITNQDYVNQVMHYAIEVYN